MKVLVALDQSSHSEFLIKTAIRRKWPADTQFKIVSVIEPIDQELEDASWLQLSEAVNRRRKEQAESLCERARHEIEKHVPTASVHYEVKEGDPCCQVINAAIDWQADKILIGSHSKTVCPHNFLGSVSRAVSQHAPCSVEVLRDKPKLVAV
jgi:nucleotide-binding universal stress UspA family protein